MKFTYSKLFTTDKCKWVLTFTLYQLKINKIIALPAELKSLKFTLLFYESMNTKSVDQ